MIRLAVVVSHPIQYYAPWFAHLESVRDLRLQVFYLWDFGIEYKHDLGFGQNLLWDVPLLDGYESKQVLNEAIDPGTHHFGGLHNPTLVRELLAWCPDAVLLFGYAYRSHLQLLLDPRLRGVPILFRGDSHQLVPRRLEAPITSLFASFAVSPLSAALSVGHANGAWLLSTGLPANRIVLAPTLSTTNAFKRQHLLPLPQLSAGGRS